VRFTESCYGSTKIAQQMAVGLSLRKETPDGTAPLKESSVPQKDKYERMGHSFVLLGHVGK